MLNNLLNLGFKCSLILILLIVPIMSKAIEATDGFITQLSCDFRNFYSLHGITHRATGFGLGGLWANTSMDPEFRILWQEHIRSDFTNRLSSEMDDYSKIAKYPVALPFYITTLWISNKAITLMPSNSLSLWANHSLRTLILGAPEQALFTHLLGSGRPQSEQHAWDLFKYHRAVSGHAFYGAIPLLNIAKQADNTLLKGTFYLLSTFPAIARINDDKHFLSQAWLGWWLALCATQTVWEREVVSKKPQNISLKMQPISHGIYLGLAKDF